jgi:uncharacterized alpha-E superfamily protein
MSAPGTIMVRARLSPDEWLALRTLALQRNRPVADLVADALRAQYPLTPPTGKGQ